MDSDGLDAGWESGKDKRLSCGFSECLSCTRVKAPVGKLVFAQVDGMIGGRKGKKYIRILHYKG